MTVSRVVNGSRRVRPETRLAVERVIAAVGYVPNGLARALTSRRTGVVGLMVPDVGNPFYAPVVRGAESIARRAGFRVFVCNSESNLAYEGEYIADMLRQRVEGLLIAPVGDESRAHLLRLEHHRIPFVLVDRTVSGVECDVVQGDGGGTRRRWRRRGSPSSRNSCSRPPLTWPVGTVPFRRYWALNAARRRCLPPTT